MREMAEMATEATGAKARAKYEAFLATIDNSIAGRDPNGSVLSDLVGGSAEQNANDTMRERGHEAWPVNDPEYWAIALETARFMLDDWRSSYPELVKAQAA